MQQKLSHVGNFGVNLKNGAIILTLKKLDLFKALRKFVYNNKMVQLIKKKEKNCYIKVL
jgi:hypothetical protein